MRDEALAAIAAAGDLDALKQVRLDHAGDRSPAGPGQPRDRRAAAAGPQGGRPAGRPGARARSTRRSPTRQAELEAEHEERMLVEETVDVTLPTDRAPRGARHPLTTLPSASPTCSSAMGWEVAEGPRSRPSGSTSTPSTSAPTTRPARCRTPSATEPPDARPRAAHAHLAGAGPHACSTRDAADLRRLPGPGLPHRRATTPRTRPMFHQVEGLVVDEGITMAHLKGTLDHFAEAMFGEGITHPVPAVVLPLHRAERRGRPGLLRLPRRQPGVETCRTCRGEGWIEWGGCGMVNPRVLAACGIDPERYTGFAFGMGIERTLMFRHGVEDMRDMFEGDVRFTAGLRNGDLSARPVSWMREYVDLPGRTSTPEQLAAA